MRKIDKTAILSKAYKTWEENLENTQQVHPTYNSSQHKFYHDIVMNLFYCQKGLCAYTEQLLCISDFYQKKHWQSGKYQQPVGLSFKGQLEHFDATQKQEKAWLWDNLFMVDTDVNTKIKKAKTIDPILKPDKPDFNPFTLLEYSLDKHIFIANTDLEEEKQERINEMLFILGVNHEPVRTVREDYLREKLGSVKYKINTWETLEILQFPTAFAFCKQAVL